MTINTISDGQRIEVRIKYSLREVERLKITKQQREVLDSITEESEISDQITKLLIISKS